MPELIRIWWSNVVLCSPIYRNTKKVLYFALKALHFIIGAVQAGLFALVVENTLIKTNYFKENELSVILSSFEERKCLIIIFILLTILLYIVDKAIRERNRIKDRINLLNLTLRWVYEDLGFDKFENEKKLDYDLRCTLWSPIKYSKDPKNMVIEQIADYCPSVSHSLSIHGNKVYKSNGRRRKVTRIDKNGELLQVGLVGKTVFFALNNRKPAQQVGYIEEGADFIEEMENVWHFSPYEAKRLTNDRRSYYCYPIMPRTCDDILALLYIDSKHPNAFTNEEGKDILIDQEVLNRYIIRISKLVQKDQNLNLSLSEGD